MGQQQSLTVTPAPPPEPRNVHFKEEVDVLYFTRGLGGCGVPHDGYITMCLDTFVERKVEPLGGHKIPSGDGDYDIYKSPRQRGALLRRDMGSSSFEKNYTKHVKIIEKIKKSQKKTKKSKDNQVYMPSSPEHAVEMGSRYAREVVKMDAGKAEMEDEPIPRQSERKRDRQAGQKMNKIIKKSFTVQLAQEALKNQKEKKKSSDELDSKEDDTEFANNSLKHDSRIPDDKILAARKSVQDAMKAFKLKSTSSSVGEDDSEEEKEDWGELQRTSSKKRKERESLAKKLARNAMSDDSEEENTAKRRRVEKEES